MRRRAGRAMRFSLLLLVAALAIAGSAAAQDRPNLNGAWRLTSEGRTVIVSLTNDSGRYFDREREVSITISRLGSLLHIVKVDSDGHTEFCQGQLVAGGRRITGTCPREGAFSMVR
jgi:hypothetical protein